MTLPGPEFAELNALLDALCDETISPPQLARLEELVLTYPEAEAYYVQTMNFQADLVGHFRTLPTRTELSLRDHVGGAGDVEGATLVEEQIGPVTLPRRRSFWVWGSLGFTGAAAAALLAVAFWGRPGSVVPTEDPDTPESLDSTVAVLLQAPKAVWGETELPTRPGAPLPPGWMRLRSGHAQIEFYSGAVVILEGPAEFKLVSRMEAYCARGKLRASVPPQAQGFTIGSPKLDLVDRGTEFGMDVGADEKTEVHVFEGKVELYDPNILRDPASCKKLKTGEGVRLESAGVVNLIASNASTFATAQDLATQFMEEAKRRQREWLKARDGLTRDSKVLVYYPFEAGDSWSRTMLDQADGRKHPRDGVIVGCSWVTGRWPGKQGLEFKQVSDRVRLNVPGQFDELTLATWVRIDALPHRFNSLFMTDSWDAKEPHWHISDEGRLELGVQGADRKGGAHYTTGTVITEEHLGRWTHLAVVFSRAQGQVAHFVDGKQVKSEPLKFDTGLRIGDAEIGNWNVAMRKHNNPVRYFTGCMDEFMIFGKALSKQDIKRLYTRGQSPL